MLFGTDFVINYCKIARCDLFKYNIMRLVFNFFYTHFIKVSICKAAKYMIDIVM